MKKLFALLSILMLCVAPIGCQPAETPADKPAADAPADEAPADAAPAEEAPAEE